MIVGIGVDTVDIGRFERSLARTPALRERLFTEFERSLSVSSMAARFAAKEALIKALGDSRGLGWHEMSVLRGEDRAPSFERTPGLTRELGALGADRVHVTMTHDAGIATAFVIVEASGAAATVVHSTADATGTADAPGPADAPAPAESHKPTAGEMAPNGGDR